MQIICDCGKKLFFGDDPDARQVCDRCGQEVSASGKPLPKRQAPKHSAPVGRDDARDDEETPRRRAGPPPEVFERTKLFVASDRKSGKGLGCLVLLIIAAGAAFAADWFLHPSVELPCGHEGKESYLFGAVPLGHSCHGLKALRFLDRARRAAQAAAQPPRDYAEVEGLPGVGSPPAGTPYRFSVLPDGSFAADPGDADSDLYHYLVEPDGTVRYEKDGEATRASPESGAFSPANAGADSPGD
jgi:hypothetical protein